MKVTQNFKNIEKVTKAFLNFVDVLVENSKDEGEELTQDEISKEVKLFVNNCGMSIILDVNKLFNDFQKDREPRYTIEMKSESDKETRRIKVDTFHSLLLAVTNFAELNAGKRHKIIVYDNKELKVIANLI